MIEIEKIQRDFDGRYEYRLRFQHNTYNVETTVTIDIGRVEQDRAYLPYMIESGVRQLFQKVADDTMRQLEEVRHHVGEYDTTALRHSLNAEMAQREMRLRDYEYERRLLTERQRLMIEQTAIYGQSILNPISEDYYERFMGVFPKSKPNPKEEKAMNLLKEKIGKKKFKDLEDKGYFEEQGKHGTYRFYKNDPSGVKCIKEIDVGGKKRPLEWTLCIQSSVANMPKGDVILSRWMEFKADEDKFQKTANWRSVKTKDEAIR